MIAIVFREECQRRVTGFCQLTQGLFQRFVQRDFEFVLLYNPEVRIEARLGRADSQNPRAKRMNRADAGAVHPGQVSTPPVPVLRRCVLTAFPQPVAQTLAHFAPGLAGKGDRHQRFQRPVGVGFQQGQHAFDQHVGLARAGGRQYYQVVVMRFDGAPLVRGQVRRHGAASCPGPRVSFTRHSCQNSQ